MENITIKEFTESYTSYVHILLKDTFENLGFGFDLSSKDKDLNDITNSYFSKHGKFWLLLIDEEIIGTIALKFLQNNCYELKRFFIVEKHRGKGYGNIAIDFIINYSKKKKIHCIKLDTNNKLLNAIHLYKKYGFSEIEPYNETGFADTKWFELKF